MNTTTHRYPSSSKPAFPPGEENQDYQYSHESVDFRALKKRNISESNAALFAKEMLKAKLQPV